MSAKKDKVTPLMKQYMGIKSKYPGALLLFRVGDFYETFGEDAVKASKILDITLTKRANGAASEVALAGFPHHAMDVYVPKLIRAGQRVAICDQLEDPKQVKGIVKRGVTELMTPGLTLSDQVLNTRSNNYLAALHFGEKGGIGFLDLSTGEFLVAEGDGDFIKKILQDFNPKECLIAKSQRDIFQFEGMTTSLDDWIFQRNFGYEKLTSQFNTPTLKGFGIEEMEEGIAAAGAILHYLNLTEHHHLGHIVSISRIEKNTYVWMDPFTIRNLELCEPLQPEGHTLLHVIDHCVTPMGHRLIKKWMVMPLKNKKDIEERLEKVAELKKNGELGQKIHSCLEKIPDLERLAAKITTARINPRELKGLVEGIKQVREIKNILAQDSPIFNEMSQQISIPFAFIERVEKTLTDEPPALLAQGHYIAQGISDTLDEYRAIMYNGKEHLQKIVKEEIQKTGISSLKISYNKIFGYYLEVTHIHKDKVPQEWIRKQTLVNAERYITPELKQYEEKIVKAESEIAQLESQLYQELLVFSAQFTNTLQQIAKNIAQLDVLQNFANMATQNNYCKPTICENYTLEIHNGRHPVIERNLPRDQKYIPNDVYLDANNQQIIIITGPNMAGKSALLRQTAMIVIMAQMGSFVPAAFANIGVVDKIFTRVGASDNLSKGESTFMVEMTETASIMNNLSSRSLVLMDEIGRGTSTYDGISIAWALVEYLHDYPNGKPKTLFATHYHELNALTKHCKRVKNYTISVKELHDKIVFLRKMVAGGSNASFGVHVAQMAGMPNAIVLRANEILQHLEKDKIKTQTQTIRKPPTQPSLFPTDPKLDKMLSIIKNIDINTLSPVEALLKLNEILDLYKGKNNE